LQEIIKFKGDITKKDSGNYDRISAMIVAMYMIKEKHAVIQHRAKQKEEKRNSFFNRPLFVDKPERNFVEM
jgi:hypothetical protein